MFTGRCNYSSGKTLHKNTAPVIHSTFHYKTLSPLKVLRFIDSRAFNQIRRRDPTLSCLSFVPLNFHCVSGCFECPAPEHIRCLSNPYLSCSCCFHCRDSWTIPRAISRSHSQRFRRHAFWLLSEMLEVKTVVRWVSQKRHPKMLSCP